MLCIRGANKKGGTEIKALRAPSIPVAALKAPIPANYTMRLLLGAKFLYLSGETGVVIRAQETLWVSQVFLNN